MAIVFSAEFGVLSTSPAGESEAAEGQLDCGCCGARRSCRQGTGL